MISKVLFEQIPDDDWRKETWIAPEDAGKAPGTKYHTLFTDENFKKVPAYVHLKFKLKEGNMIDANVGAPIDNLLMRVEEMYFIAAAAIAASQGGKRWNFCFGEFYENLSLQFLPMYGICYGRFS